MNKTELRNRLRSESNPVTKMIDQLGLQEFNERVQEEKHKSCGLLTDVACVYLAVFNYFEEEII
jgi:hypothetical protein